MAREVLDTGETSISNSGDTLHAGGNKIVNNFDEIYDALGDQRLSSTYKSSGDETYQTIHATGYFQHLSLSDYSSAVDSGSMHDIDSSLATSDFDITLPDIGQSSGSARLGEMVVLQDSGGNWGTIPVYVSPGTDQNIEGMNSDSVYELNIPNTRAYFIVSSEETDNETWKVHLEPMSGESGGFVNNTVTLTDDSTTMTLYKTANYDIAKFEVYCAVYDSNDSLTENCTFEISIMTNGSELLSTKYSILSSLGTGEDSLFVTVTPSISTINNINYVIITIEQTESDTDGNTVYFVIKSISGTKLRL